MSAATSPRSLKEQLRRGATVLTRALLRLGSRPYEVAEGMTVVIAPHQDDETLACGGVIAAKRNEGLPVHVIFITDGSASHPAHPRLDGAAIAALRREEARRALACLHVEQAAVHFLDQPDGRLHRLDDEAQAQLIRRLCECLVTLNPTELFLPCRPDGSSEHDAVFGFVLRALHHSRRPATVWGYPVWSWWNPLILVRRWLASNDCRHLLLADQRAAKHAALACYQSQVAPLPPQETPALPANFLRLFQGSHEYFFRVELPPSP